MKGTEAGGGGGRAPSRRPPGTPSCLRQGLRRDLSQPVVTDVLVGGECGSQLLGRIHESAPRARGAPSHLGGLSLPRGVGQS